MVLALGSLLLNPNEMKHIESIQPEYAAFELDRIGREETDATASAALTALLHNVTGCAIPPTADTPQSEVEELVPLCLNILRRHWTTPLTALGDGNTPMSLADLMRRLIGDRVQGNEAWSIPPFTADIPTAVAALTQRDMSSGLTLTLTDGTDGSTPTTTSLPDGLSFAQLLCGVSPDGTDLASSVTELHDSNKGGTWTNTFTQFPNAKRITFNAAGDKVYGSPLIQHSGVEELNVPYLNRVEEGNSSQGSNFFRCPNLRVFRLDRLTFWQGGYKATEMPLLKELYMPNCQSYLQSITYGGFNAPELEKWVLGKLTSFKMANNNGTNFMASCHNLIHIEVGEGTACSLPMDVWNPTTALAERLPEFLQNFKTYIAQRLTDKGSGLTLTLSQAVRDAIQQDPEIVSIITSKGWTISPAPSV